MGEYVLAMTPNAGLVVRADSFALRDVSASSPASGVVLDFFAGSGTAGDAALSLGRGLAWFS
jgi:16S rRNA G966 N2-methylase RsmD